MEAHRGGDLPALTDELVRACDPVRDLGDGLSIAEVAEVTGTTAHTLRYYERIGLVDVDRDAAGRRTYSREALGRIVFITKLRLSDMPIRNIQQYVELVKLGDSTVPERLEIMERHRSVIQSRLEDMQWALAVIDYKISTYGGNCQP
ncbi:MerR family transcriptional regulator [Antricoccus suffuscus]|uniref:MerR family transcriptional regulator n=2 Tax=Antricoccus suffuscus TaxID=1629062 RepID=A0A2T0Z344_9ACTN|nr:MerR family transcriptional regulator [Antricoccus suffuscus]